MKLKPNQHLVCIGQTALRGPDGTPLPSVPMYIIADKSTVNPKTGHTLGEAETLDDIAAVLAPMFKQYVDGVANSDSTATPPITGATKAKGIYDEIRAAQKMLDSHYDLGASEAKELIRMGSENYELVYNAFLLGYQRGRKAEYFKQKHRRKSKGAK